MLILIFGLTQTLDLRYLLKYTILFILVFPIDALIGYQQLLLILFIDLYFSKLCFFVNVIFKTNPHVMIK